MNKLEKAASIVLKKCMDAKPKEKILILIDKKMRKLGKPFLKTAQKYGSAELIEIPTLKWNSQEPGKKAAKELQNCDVALIITSKSLSHTKARCSASKKGARIASMPGLRIKTANRALDINYKKLNELNKKLIKKLTKADKIKVITKKGTDITFSVKGRKVFDDNGIYTRKGSFGNLPAGEVCLAPTDANGAVIVDQSFAGIGRLSFPIKLTVKDGYAIKIQGKHSEKIKRSIKNKKYSLIAEFGIGTNPKAKLSGITLEDEKVIGTCHFALGNNASFGGRNNVPLHIDGVINKPTIFIDGKKVMEDGRFLAGF